MLDANRLTYQTCSPQFGGAVLKDTKINHHQTVAIDIVSMINTFCDPMHPTWNGHMKAIKQIIFVKLWNELLLSYGI